MSLESISSSKIQSSLASSSGGESTTEKISEATEHILDFSGSNGSNSVDLSEISADYAELQTLVPTEREALKENGVDITIGLMAPITPNPTESDDDVPIESPGETLQEKYGIGSPIRALEPIYTTEGEPITLNPIESDDDEEGIIPEMPEIKPTMLHGGNPYTVM